MYFQNIYLVCNTQFTPLNTFFMKPLHFKKILKPEKSSIHAKKKYIFNTNSFLNKCSIPFDMFLYEVIKL